MNARVLAVRDVVTRVRNGVNPYSGGPFDQTQMLVVADEFSNQVQHDPFVEGLREKVSRGEDVSEYIKGYLSVVFAQGFSAGSRYETLEGLGEKP